MSEIRYITIGKKVYAKEFTQPAAVVHDILLFIINMIALVSAMGGMLCIIAIMYILAGG